MATGISKLDIRGIGDHQDPHNTNFESKPEKSEKSKKSSIASYVIMPGIIPQIKELARGGFGYLAFLIAMVYQAVRILPATHPYTKYENLGTFGIRHVIAAAANNVQINRKNIDQIVVFFAIIAGLLIMAMQFLLFIGVLISGDAWAQTPPTYGGLFDTPNPQTDVAFHMLREVFGIPDMFGTLATGATPSMLHQALHAMINFYNLAILLIAVLVFLYYVVVVVAETAQTGTPFGQRFNHIYAPLRLVIAIGLLVPLNWGFNSAQYITLYAAKTGSGFATTGWSEFNNALVATNPLGAETSTLIAEIKGPDIEGLVSFMAMAVTCREAMALHNEPTNGATTVPIRAYIIRRDPPGVTSIGNLSPSPTAAQVSAYLAVLGGVTSSIGTEDIRIVFGAPATEAGKYEQDIKPHCGSLVIPVSVPGASATDYSGLQMRYFSNVLGLWNSPDLTQIGGSFAAEHTMSMDCAASGYGCPPVAAQKDVVISNARTAFDSAITSHYSIARTNANFAIRNETLLRGWGGAGIWYNRIAEENGAYTVTVMNVPSPQQYPDVMEYVLSENKKANNKFKACEAYEPALSDGEAVNFNTRPNDEYYAGVYNAAYQYWTCDKQRNTGNFFLDAASAIFGLNGLMSIRQTTTDASGATVQVHPLAKLSALGKGLIEAAIRNMAFAIGASVFGGVSEIISQQLAGAAVAASSMFVSIATIGLSIGFITYYILPFLPFIYFFFAVGSWVKSIFEAMVGAPLWALAHLRIDGDGIPGKMAMNGYLLILEIFLRPILTVFGLVGGMAIFSAMAAMLNELFDLVVVNTAGVDLQAVNDAQVSRHIIDVFFFTVVYAVILYMMAVSSFKMINLVPNNILRWLGQSVASFSDNAPDPAQGLTQYAAIGGARIGGQLAGGITSGARGVGQGISGVLQLGAGGGRNSGGGQA